MANLEEPQGRFGARYAVWLIVSHFLPVALYRDLIGDVVRMGSGQTVNLADLFDEIHYDEDSLTGAFALEPRPVTGQTHYYFQTRVRYLMWKNDMEVNFQPEKLDPTVAENANAIEQALRVARFEDIAAINVADQYLSLLFQAFQNLLRERAPVDEISALTDGLEAPLGSLLLKHAGDWLAWGGEWTMALRLYEKAEAHLGRRKIERYWRDAVPIFEAIIKQSITTALFIVAGAKKGAFYIDAINRKKRLPLLAINGALDAMVVQDQADPHSRVGDSRAIVYQSPLLLSSHSNGSALRAARERHHLEASRRFKSVLRRQISLGSSSDARVTRSFFAAALLDQLKDERRRYADSDTFYFIVTLLLESGNPDFVAVLEWEPALLKSALSVETIDNYWDAATRYAGDTRWRLAVLLELFAAWIDVIPGEDDVLANRLMSYLVRLQHQTWTRELDDVSTLKQVKLLTRAARNRPEFRAGFARTVAGFVAAFLAEPRRAPDVRDVVDLADSFLTVMPADCLFAITKAVLIVLQRLPPGSGDWITAGAAVDFLTSQGLKAFLSAEDALMGEVLDSVLRVGIEQRSAHVRLMHLLSRFSSFELKEDVTDRMTPIVAHMCERALKINSSDAVSNVIALLVAPKFAGERGIETAMEAIVSIIASAATGRSRISFPSASDGLRLLVYNREELVAQFPKSERFDEICFKVLRALLELWLVAAEDPMIFSEFSIPAPAVPNAVLVHNWTLASLNFGNDLGQELEMRAALKRASDNPQLAEAVAWGLASWSVAAREPDRIDLDEIRGEPQATFYKAIGQRLIQLRKLSGSMRDAFLNVLCSQCLRHGPREIDAAVFAQMTAIVPGDDFSIGMLRDYLTRLNKPGPARLTVRPMLYTLCSNLELEW